MNVRIPPALSDQPLAEMLGSVLPGVDTSNLRETIASEMRSDFSGLEEAAADLRRRGGPGQLALGLALGSPEFQRH